MLVVEGGHELRQARSLRIPERGIERLDGEDVREVAAELEPEIELDRALGVIRADDVILHTVPDEAPAGHRDGVLPEAVGDGVA